MPPASDHNSEDQSDIIDRIYLAIDETPAALSRVALYIAQNPDASTALTIGELGQVTGSGQATVLRLCRHLGFSGFREFKMALTAEVAREKALRARSIKAERATTGDQKLDGLSEALQASIQTTAELIDPDQVRRLADAFLTHRQVTIFGVGVSNACADVLAYRLLWLGIGASVPRTDLIAKGVAATLGPGTMALGISFSGVTEATTEFLKTAGQAGAMTIAVTTRPDSTLAKGADETVLLSRIGPWPKDGSVRLIPPITIFTEYLAEEILTRQRV